jgi:hypothetical protein
VLQHRAEELTAPSTPAEKKHLLDSATKLMQTLSLHHLQDHDPRLHLNLGWLEQALIVMDPGRIAHCDVPQSELPNKFTEFAK